MRFLAQGFYVWTFLATNTAFLVSKNSSDGIHLSINGKNAPLRSHEDLELEPLSIDGNKSVWKKRQSTLKNWKSEKTPKFITGREHPKPIMTIETYRIANRYRQDPYGYPEYNDLYKHGIAPSYKDLDENYAEHARNIRRDNFIPPRGGVERAPKRIIYYATLPEVTRYPSQPQMHERSFYNPSRLRSYNQPVLKGSDFITRVQSSIIDVKPNDKEPTFTIMDADKHYSDRFLSDKHSGDNTENGPMFYDKFHSANYRPYRGEDEGYHQGPTVATFRPQHHQWNSIQQYNNKDYYQKYQSQSYPHHQAYLSQSQSYHSPYSQQYQTSPDFAYEHQYYHRGNPRPFPTPFPTRYERFPAGRPVIYEPLRPIITHNYKPKDSGKSKPNPTAYALELLKDRRPLSTPMAVGELEDYRERFPSKDKVLSPDFLSNSSPLHQKYSDTVSSINSDNAWGGKYAENSKFDPFKSTYTQVSDWLSSKPVLELPEDEDGKLDTLATNNKNATNVHDKEQEHHNTVITPASTTTEENAESDEEE